MVRNDKKNNNKINCSIILNSVILDNIDRIQL